MNLTELDSLITGLKNSGLDPKTMRYTIQNILSAQGLSLDDKLDVPKFGADDATVTETVPTSIRELVEQKVPYSNEIDPSEDWDAAKAKADVKNKSKEAEDKLEAQRQAALPENQEQYEDEESRIRKNSPITVGAANSGKANGEFKMKGGVANALLELYPEHKANEIWEKFNQAYADGLSAQQAFSSVFKAKDLLDILQTYKNKYPDDKKREHFENFRKTIENEYKNENSQFDKAARLAKKRKEVQDHILSQMRASKKAAVRGKDKLTNAILKQTEGKKNDLDLLEQTPDEDSDGRYTKLKGVASPNKANTQLRQTLLNYGQDNPELANALYSMVQDPKSYEQDISGKSNIDRVNEKYFEKPRNSAEHWTEYFNEHPNATVYNIATSKSMKDGIIKLVFYPDGVGNGGGKVRYFAGEDAQNFARGQNASDTPPKIKTSYAYLNSEGGDVSEKKLAQIQARFDSFFNGNSNVAPGDFFFLNKLNKVKEQFDKDTGITNYIFLDQDDKPYMSDYIANQETPTWLDKAEGILKRYSGNSAYIDSADDLNEFIGNNPVSGLSPHNKLHEYLESIRKNDGDEVVKKIRRLLHDITALRVAKEGNTLDNKFVGKFMGNGPILKDNELKDLNSKTLGKYNLLFSKLRKRNPSLDKDGVSVVDIINNPDADLGTLFGSEIWTDQRIPAISAYQKLRALRDAEKDEDPLKLNDLRKSIEGNIDAVNEVINSGKFPDERTGLQTPEEAAEALRRLWNAKLEFATPQEITAHALKQVANPQDVAGMKTLAEQYPEELEAAKKAYKHRVEDLEEARATGSKDDVLFATEERDKANRKIHYLETTKLDIKKLADELGKPYDEVYNDYIAAPDMDSLSDEDYIDTSLYRDRLYEKIQKLINDKGKNSDSVVALDTLDKLNKANGIDSNWKELVLNRTPHINYNQLLSGAPLGDEGRMKTLTDMTGLTAKEIAAWLSNEQLKRDMSAAARRANKYGTRTRANPIVVKSQRNGDAVPINLDENGLPLDVDSYEALRQKNDHLEPDSEYMADGYVTRNSDLKRKILKHARSQKDDDMDKELREANKRLIKALEGLK